MGAHLPVSRIKTIMKSCCGVEQVSKESTVILTKASELLIAQLSKKAIEASKNKKKLDYKDVATVVHSESKYEFLREIIPHKITVLQYRKLMEKQAAQRKEDGEDSEEEEEEYDEEKEHDEEEKETTKSQKKITKNERSRRLSSKKANMDTIDLTLSPESGSESESEGESEPGPEPEPEPEPEVIPANEVIVID